MVARAVFERRELAASDAIPTHSARPARGRSGRADSNRRQVTSALPDYWIERPPMRLSRSAQSAIEEFLSLDRAAVADGLVDVGTLLRFDREDVTPRAVPVRTRRTPRGSPFTEPAIRTSIPSSRREPIDVAPFGHQKAVFATSDPIWAMFYAIVDRDRYAVTLNNGCISADGLGRSSWRALLLLLDHSQRVGAAAVANRLRLFPAGRELRRAARWARTLATTLAYLQAGERGRGNTIRTPSSRSAATSVPRAHSRPWRRPAGRVRASRNGRSPLARVRDC